MKLRLLFALTLTLALNTFSALPPEYEKLKADAEKFYLDTSFSKAHEVYQKAEAMKLPVNELLWVQFRLARFLLCSLISATDLNLPKDYHFIGE